jgi:hypothetical protein
MKPASIPALLAFVAVGMAASPAAAPRTGAAASGVLEQQKETETVDRNFPLDAGGLLKLNNFSGPIHITGSNRPNVAIHAVRRATRDRLDHIRLDIRASASQITIEANKKDDTWREKNDNVVETSFEIDVPQGVELDIQAFSSDVHVESVTGRQKLHTFSGTIQVDDATGRIDAETFSGEIKAAFQQNSKSPDVRMKTFSGDIDVRLGTSAQGRVDFSSFSGSLDSSLPLRYRSGSRRNVRGELGAGGATNDLEFNTFSGDVRLRD